MAKTKVLTLGWEFPPLLAGGLGIACYGLVKSLSTLADITLLIPRSDKEFLIDNVDIIGLNHITIEDIDTDRRFFDYARWAARVSKQNPEVNPAIFNKNYTEQIFHLEQSLGLFSEGEVYGPNIMQKVQVYSDMASKLCANKKFDVIHAHDWITFPAAMRLQRELRIPLVVHIHSLESDRIGESAKNGHNSIYEVERQAMLNANGVITVSHFTKNNAIEHYGIDANKIHPVYNGKLPISPVRYPHHLPEKLVAFIGRVTHQKGPYHLLETAEKVLRERKDVRFIIAGTGDMLNGMIERTAELGLSKHFIYTGFLPKARVNELLNTADVYFMPSVSEPFGLSAVEAAQHDVPCVISTQSGVAELLHHALKADYWDTDKLAKYIISLLDHSEMRQTIIINTRADLEAIDWDISAERVVEVYGRIC